MHLTLDHVLAVTAIFSQSQNTQIPNCNMLIWKYKIAYLGHSTYRGNYSFFCQNVATREHISNRYITPSTHHLHTGLITRHITASRIVPGRLNNFNSQDFNHYPFLTNIYITYTILTVIIIILNCYGMMLTQLTRFVPLYSCDNNITLKMAAVAAETCW
jgi:hypothetical protein